MSKVLLALVASMVVTNASASAQFNRDKPARYDIDILSEDVISPVSIEHKVDEILDHGELKQRYNYLDYRFERDGAYMRARAYLYEIQSVAIYGPFSVTAPNEPVRSDELQGLVLEYLKRRFSVIKTLSRDEPDGYTVLVPSSPPH